MARLRRLTAVGPDASRGSGGDGGGQADLKQVAELWGASPASLSDSAHACHEVDDGPVTEAHAGTRAAQVHRRHPELAGLPFDAEQHQLAHEVFETVEAKEDAASRRGRFHSMYPNTHFMKDARLHESRADICDRLADMATRRPTAFGAFLLRRMQAVGFGSQTALADATGLSPASVSRLLYSDEYEPDARTLKRLSEALKVPLAELVVTRFGDDFLDASLADLPILHPLAVQVHDLLRPDSPLPAEERDLLERLIGMGVDRAYAKISDSERRSRRRRDG